MCRCLQTSQINGLKFRFVIHSEARTRLDNLTKILSSNAWISSWNVQMLHFPLCRESVTGMLRIEIEFDMVLCFGIRLALCFFSIRIYLQHVARPGLLKIIILKTSCLSVHPSVLPSQLMNIGIKHDFPFINIREVLREVLKTEGKVRGFQHLPRDLANVNEWQNHVGSLLLHKFNHNTSKIEKMFAHFILQPYHHFLARARFL